MNASSYIQTILNPDQIVVIAKELRHTMDAPPPSMDVLLEVLEAWADALSDPALRDINGLAFLRLWLRRSTIKTLLTRELGESMLTGNWKGRDKVYIKPFPVGIVGHWPAANIEIQPALSMVCALLGGNAALVRVPTGIVAINERIIAKLFQADTKALITPRISLLSFSHSESALQKAMAKNVDGAMIWGGEESVLTVRGLPFPHWCRVAVFGPRISASIMDLIAWQNPDTRKKWCQRLARDVWQFDQQACSSPQTLFVEKNPHMDIGILIAELKHAFEEENRVHSRKDIASGSVANIVLGRASWLINNPTSDAVFPLSPDWTILIGESSDLPDAIQGKTLFVLQVDSLQDAVSKLDGNVQTLGLAIGDLEKEAELAEIACRRGVDRVVKLGRMHVFDSPWDGRELIKPMVRMTRYFSSED